MLKDIPYSELKQNGRAYEIMLLRDQDNCTFAHIAKKYSISGPRVMEIYRKTLIQKLHLYIHHISAVLGYEDTAQVRKVYHETYECFQDWKYVCAHFEKEYQDILTAYRAGEPGIPAQFAGEMPPFRDKLDDKTIARVIEMREAGRASFAAIAKELEMTQAKAKHTYDMFYHQKGMEIVNALQNKAETKQEKNAIWNCYFRNQKSPKTQYDWMVKEHPSL